MSKSGKQTKVVFQWLGAPDIALFKLVQQAASSMSEPTSLVLAARRTLCIAYAVQDTNAPQVQHLVKHAVRVVGLLCRAYMEGAVGQNWHAEGGQILADLLILLPKILHLVNKVRLFDGFRMAVYLEELRSSTVKVASLVTRPQIRFEHSAVSLEPPVEREEEQVMVAERRKTKRRADFPFAPPPTHPPYLTAVPPYPTGYPLPASPLLPYDATHYLCHTPSIPPAFPSGGVYFAPSYPPVSMLSNYNSGNVQSINITHNHQYFGTPRQGSTRRRESSVRDQLRMAQDIVQATSPPYWDIPPHATFANYPPSGSHPFAPWSPMQYSAPLANRSYPAASLPSSLSNLDARTVPNISTMNPTPKSHQNEGSSRL